MLYLALEDDYARLQKRLSRMFGIESSDYFYLSVRAKSLSEGLCEQLENFVKAHRDTKLMIIDTLQKVKEASGDRYSYSIDYEIVTKLKAFSDTYGVCLLLVHHTRKLESEDSFEMISGTNGLLGAADGAFIMQKKKRTDNIAVLDIVGRNQPDQELTIEFERETCIWKFRKAETELWKQPPDLFCKPNCRYFVFMVILSVFCHFCSLFILLIIYPIFENGVSTFFILHHYQMCTAYGAKQEVDSQSERAANTD